MMIKTFADVRVALASNFASSQSRGGGSLERMYRLLACIGDPQEQFKVVHVAGTSGKTSTAYYAAALLHQAGHSVGLTISPHTVEINDRLQIDGRPLPEAEFCAKFETYLSIVKQCAVDPTYFELMLGFAFWEFARQKLEYAVVEVAVGGLLDPTNVLTRIDKICIITDIGFDHMDLLGHTLPEIANQKAGIIQAHNVAFVYDQGHKIMPSFYNRARQKQADLRILSRADMRAPDYLPLFQQRNFGLARAAIAYVLDRDHDAAISEKMVQAAAAITIPGRMEVFHYHHKTIILDGAHNGQKMQALLKSVRAKYDQPFAMLVGFVDGKNADTRMHDILPQCGASADRLIATQFGGPQDAPYFGVPVGDIVQVGRESGVRTIIAETQPDQAFQALLDSPQDILVVAGSLYLLNHIRPLVAVT
ncbi:MAG: bifunctional folylpolyglutamate synthase/dihydrofolate synthase [Candidatus Saccharibacteria bacterium]